MTVADKPMVIQPPGLDQQELPFPNLGNVKPANIPLVSEVVPRGSPRVQVITVARAVAGARVIEKNTKHASMLLRRLMRPLSKQH